MARTPPYPREGGPRGAAAAVLGDAVLADPLEHFAAEHMRKREMCGWLDALAAAVPRPERALAAEALAHLERARPRHVRDEEADLFPLLRRRSEGDDEINDTLDRLSADHAQAAGAAERVRAALARVIATDTAFTPQEAAAVTAFAARERRHLIVENAIVLPLARARLTRRDLDALRRRMVQRREDERGEAEC